MKLFEAAKTVDIVKVYEKITGKTPKKTKKGAMANCPFHQDEKPSLGLFNDKNTFYCFGCHTYGSVVDLAEKLLNVESTEAAKWICREFGVEYDAPRVISVSEPNQNPENEIPLEQWLQVNRQLAAYFRANLPHSPNPRFFDERGVGSLAEEFSFGYCPKGQIFGKGKDDEGMRKSIERARAFLLGNERGECMFAGRYVVPITDFHGNVLGFIGRLPDNEIDDDHPKYLISENSRCFRKRDVFFNAGALLDKNAGEIIVVEGVFDALSYIAAGVRSVVSPLGCSLSDQQLRTLRRQPDRKVVIAFDRDEAGNKATMKAVKYAKDLKVAVLISDFKAQKDANALLLSEGADYLSNATESMLAPDYLLMAYEKCGLLVSEKGQEALWTDLAGAIGCREPEFKDKYPINLAYNPVAFTRFWSKFDSILEKHPLK